MTMPQSAPYEASRTSFLFGKLSRDSLPHDPIVLSTMVVVIIGGIVHTIKLDASYYLAKPSNTEDIEAAFARADGDPDASIDGRQSSIRTVEWEHIHHTLVETDFNISETARRLGMHRRTLARKLEKRQLR